MPTPEAAGASGTVRSLPSSARAQWLAVIFPGGAQVLAADHTPPLASPEELKLLNPWRRGQPRDGLTTGPSLPPATPPASSPR